MTMLRWLFPRDWGERYFDEMQDLRSRGRSRGDWFDLARLAARLRLEQLARRPRALVVTSLLLLVAGTGGIAWSVPQLAHGWSDLLGHWWSAPWVALALAGAAGSVAVLGRG
ncbi:MAG: hypothetical protein ABR520_06535 [Mycobacteriales bacterium]